MINAIKKILFPLTLTALYFFWPKISNVILGFGIVQQFPILYALFVGSLAIVLGVAAFYSFSHYFANMQKHPKPEIKISKPSTKNPDLPKNVVDKPSLAFVEPLPKAFQYTAGSLFPHSPTVDVEKKIIGFLTLKEKVKLSRLNKAFNNFFGADISFFWQAYAWGSKEKYEPFPYYCSASPFLPVPYVINESHYDIKVCLLNAILQKMDLTDRANLMKQPDSQVEDLRKKLLKEPTLLNFSNIGKDYYALRIFNYPYTGEKPQEIFQKAVPELLSYFKFSVSFKNYKSAVISKEVPLDTLTKVLNDLSQSKKKPMSA